MKTMKVVQPETVRMQVESLRGPQGIPGAQGERGERGPQGERGERGPAGAQGEQHHGCQNCCENSLLHVAFLSLRLIFRY